MAAKHQHKVRSSISPGFLNNDSALQSAGFIRPLPREFNHDLFERALKGSQGALEELVEKEKPILFDYALRMTGEINRSWEAIQEQVNSLNASHLGQCGNSFVFRQALLMGLRNQLQSIWHRDTSRLENAAYLAQMNPDTENLKSINSNETSIARDFDREFHHLPGQEREALWLKARLQATPEEIVQVMSVKIQEVERSLVAALFRLENKSYGCDPESLVARLPFHPMPAPMTQVTMELSQVMQGIRKSQKTTSRNLNLGVAFILFVISVYFISEIFFRPGKKWLILDLSENLKDTFDMPEPEKVKSENQRFFLQEGSEKIDTDAFENEPKSHRPAKEAPLKSGRALESFHQQ
jgi:DNA-directed RNA polymerase specialized sigma24 family protein